MITLLSLSAILLIIFMNSVPLWAAISPSIDFTTVVSDHAMLIILALICIGAISVFAIKFFLEKMNKSLNDSQEEISKKNAEILTVQGQLKQNEIDHLKLEMSTLTNKYNIFENKHNSCIALMPSTYVSKLDYDRFVQEHRQELTHMSNRVETMIKELKVEIKEDLAQQIERILKLLETKLG
jgi:HAMP domain-containing protein